MGPTEWKVGALAEASGLTVRTLHHYDELGLVSPSRRTAAGHRIYGPEDVERLYRVRALRQLGVPLDRAAGVLAGEVPLADVLREQSHQLDAQLSRLLVLRSHLRGLLDRAGSVPAEELLALTEEMVTMDDVTRQYFDEDQLAQLAERRERIGTDEIERVERAWPDLIARVEQARADGVDPASDAAAGLAQEWMGLLEAFHGGDPGLRDSLYRMYDENAEQIHTEWVGPSPDLIAWISEVQAAHR